MARASTINEIAVGDMESDNTVNTKPANILQRLGQWLIGHSTTPVAIVHNELPQVTSTITRVSAWSLDEAIGAFVNHNEAKNLAVNTASFYHYRFSAFRRYCHRNGINSSIDQITPFIIRDFIANERARVSDVTSERSFTTLRAFFNFLVKEGALITNPMVNIKKPKVKKKIIPTLTPAQIKLMLDACGKGLIGVRNRAIIRVLYDCGLRVSELCNIRMADITDLDKKSL